MSANKASPAGADGRIWGDVGSHLGGHGLAVVQAPARAMMLQVEGLALAHGGGGLIDAGDRPACVAKLGPPGYGTRGRSWRHPFGVMNALGGIPGVGYRPLVKTNGSGRIPRFDGGGNAFQQRASSGTA